MCHGVLPAPERMDVVDASDDEGAEAEAEDAYMLCGSSFVRVWPRVVPFSSVRQASPAVSAYAGPEPRHAAVLCCSCSSFLFHACLLGCFALLVLLDPSRPVQLRRPQSTRPQWTEELH